MTDRQKVNCISKTSIISTTKHRDITAQSRLGADTCDRT